MIGHDFVGLGSPMSAPGGHFHLHGGNATADAGAAGGNATSLLVLDDGVAHTPGASFVARPGAGGTAYRLTTTRATATTAATRPT